MEAFNELQRLSGSPECAARYLETVADLDVRELLSQVRALTVVMHVRDDPRVPSDLGRELAAGITGATVRGATGQEPCPVGARPRPAPLLRGTERLFDVRILAARRLAGALIGGMKFSYAMFCSGRVSSEMRCPRDWSRSSRAPWKGGALQWVTAPPATASAGSNRSSDGVTKWLKPSASVSQNTVTARVWGRNASERRANLEKDNAQADRQGSGKADTAE